jgi:hypothetical protein
MVQPSKIYVLFSKPTIYALGVAGAATAAAAGLGAVAGAATAAAAGLGAVAGAATAAAAGLGAVAGAATAAAAGLGAVAGAATAAAAVGVLDAKGFDVPQEPSGRGQWKLGGGKSMACVRK